MSALPQGARFSLFAAVLAGILLFYSGLFHSSDAQYTVALTESLVTRGEFVTSPLWWHQDAIDSVAPDGESYAKAGIGASLVAAPLYLLAFFWPGLGMVQAVTLTSALLTALNAVILCRLVERLGVGPRTALVVALLWAFGTSALVYASYYFTEPISALTLTATLYGVVAWRAERRTRHLWLIGFAVSLAVATKLVNALFVAPFLLHLVVLAWRVSPVPRRLDRPARESNPVTRGRFANRPYVDGLLALWPAVVPVALTLIGIGLYNAVRYGSPLNSGYPAYETFDHPLLDGLWGLLVSSQKGVVWYNPLLFASLWSFTLFARRFRAEALVIVATTIMHLGLYAVYFLWDGGLTWGPRYLVPLLPLWMLPVALWLDSERRARWTTGVFVLICAASVAVQVGGATISFLRFNHVRDELGALAQAWPVIGHLSLLGRTDLWDFAWMRAGTPDGLLFVVMLGFGVLAVIALYVAARKPLSHPVLALIVLGAVAAPLFLLARSADDPRYGGGADYDRLLRDFAARASRNEVMLLDNHVRTSYFLNQNRALPRWYALDRHADGSARTLELLDRLLARYGTIWLVSDLSPGGSAPRPVEAWLSARAFKVDDAAYSAYARLLRYDVLPPGAPRDVNARFGDEIELHAVDWRPPSTTSSTAYLTLEWRALSKPAQDYTVFVQLLGADNRVAWQSDRPPVDGFRPTSTWMAGETVSDRYAFRRPDNLPPGGYRVIAGLYDWRTGARLPVADAQGRPAGDFVTLAASN
ncbi:MAG: phospholipid carrier-dependent glycosyltransferase [Chloroflexi bacterium]|nr:phospholipid carrier-dependent glycosyltransferase [Chloroflexota bacterium]